MGRSTARKIPISSSRFAKFFKPGQQELGALRPTAGARPSSTSHLYEWTGAPALDVRTKQIGDLVTSKTGTASLSVVGDDKLLFERAENDTVFVAEGVTHTEIANLEEIAEFISQRQERMENLCLITETYAASRFGIFQPHQGPYSTELVGNVREIDAAFSLQAKALLDLWDKSHEASSPTTIAYLCRTLHLQRAGDNNLIEAQMSRRTYLIPVGIEPPNTQKPRSGVREQIHILQEQAFRSAGISPNDVPDLFASRKARIEWFEAQHGNYVLGGLDPKKVDTAQEYLKSSLSQRYERDTPTPLQDPFVYSWLQDTWRHYSTNYYQDDALDRQLVLATAPTGDFNAKAISGEKEIGIVLDDGLPNLGRYASKQLGQILYKRQTETSFGLRDFSEMTDHLQRDPEPLLDLAQAILDYITDGAPPRTSAIVDNDRSSISNSIFFSFICFVIEHELHHISVRRSQIDGARIDDAFEAAMPKLVTLLDHKSKQDAARMEQTFRNHNEEIEADVRGLNLVLVRARSEGTTWPSLDGSLMFFYLADSIRHTLLLFTDRQQLVREQGLDGDMLTLEAIARLESHPYPLVRRAGAIETIRRASAPYGALLLEADKRLDFIFKSIKDLILRSVPETAGIDDVHARWLRSDRD